MCECWPFVGGRAGWRRGRLVGGMKATMGFDEFRDADVGVDGRGFELHMTEHRLNVANVAPIAQESGGEGVAQGVTAASLAGQGAANETRDMVSEQAGFQSLAFCVEKDGVVARPGGELRTHFGEVFFHPAQRAITDGHHAVARAFAEIDSHGLAGDIEVRKIKPAEFAAADAGGVK